MGGVSFDTIANRVVGLGDNKFESGKIAVAAGTTIAAGTILKRSGDNFAPVVNTTGSGSTPGDIPVAVMPFDLKNESSASATLPFRALIFGDVRKDMLTINGVSITKAQVDMLRNYGIIAVATTDMSRVNP
jgi:hypothetical protein